MLLEQCATLPFGHATPHAELDPVVEGVGPAFQDDGTVPADHCGFALRGAPHEQFVGVGLAAAGLRNPSDTSLGLCAVDNTVG
jgi:hypothetical protein